MPVLLPLNSFQQVLRRVPLGARTTRHEKFLDFSRAKVIVLPSMVSEHCVHTCICTCTISIYPPSQRAGLALLNLHAPTVPRPGSGIQEPGERLVQGRRAP